MATIPLPEEAWVATRLHRVAAGGADARQALAELYQAYRRPVLLHLMHHRLSPEVADDVLHQVFIKVAERAGQWRGDGSAAGWVWAVVRSTRLDAHRGEHELGLDDDAWDALLEVTAAAPTDTNSHDLQRCVVEGIQRFAREHPERADAVRLLHLEGWSVAQLAPYLGRTAGATREFLSQCRRVLKPYLQPCLIYLRPES